MNVFTEDELDALHNATLEVLSEAGIKVESEEAIEIFESAGARVERISNYAIVKFPHYLVEDCIRYAPRNVADYGRNSEKDFILEPHRIGFSTFGECIQVIDPDTRQVRKSVKSDLAGTLVQYNAEVLSAIMLAQLTRKGTPCTTMMDLRFMITAVGAPEYGIISAGLAKRRTFG